MNSRASVFGRNRRPSTIDCPSDETSVPARRSSLSGLEMVDQERINDDFATMVGARAQERDAQRIRMEDRPRQSSCQQAAEQGQDAR